jgi:hypothetical protein
MNALKRLWVVRTLKKQFYEWDAATLHRHQAKRVDEILTYARAHSPYYGRILSQSTTLDAVPVVDKAQMMAHFDEINSAGLRKEELIPFRIEQEREGRLDRARRAVGDSRCCPRTNGSFTAAYSGPAAGSRNG